MTRTQFRNPQKNQTYFEDFACKMRAKKQMALKRPIFILTLLIVLTSCDPVHDLTLENRTNQTIEVMYQPYLDTRQLKGKESKKINIQGKKMYMVALDSSETITIGTVAAMYIPSANDIDLDFLEVRYGSDTIRLTGKNAILKTIQKVEELDWRLIIK